MTDHASDNDWGDSADSSSPNREPQVGSIEAYETDDAVVLFDADNPLAWVEASRTVSLKERA